ncbi:glucosaminidase domain-containing protein [Marinospirillum perlucidum]|uniref:glucosaminidase domain-containing protein n=1 Tax=Marinospirillum perlucidum TaxID=1982602 RepID=UPI000DF4100B|nr:glucosaminidase domain-containing protein [Marinospirillum perlucidum]
MYRSTSSPLFLRILLLISFVVALGALWAEIWGPKPRLQSFNQEAPDPLQSLPDLKSIQHIPWRKEAFFDALVPLVVYENQRIAWQRQQLQTARDYYAKGEAEHLTASDQQLLSRILSHYRTDPPATPEAWDALLKRVRPVPLELVLMQAAKESAWGGSRFAREGNNLFGQWCFVEGCGLVPLQRTPDMRHEVKVFPNVQASVRSYMQNINTHAAYRDLRRLRSSFYARGEQPEAVDLAPGLIHYSERGQAYVRELVQLLHSNAEVMDQALLSYQEEKSSQQEQ